MSKIRVTDGAEDPTGPRAAPKTPTHIDGRGNSPASQPARSNVLCEIPPELMLTMVLDALPVGLFWKDRDSRILGCNQKFADDSGAANPTDLIGKTNFDSYPSAVAEAYRADDLEVIGSGQSKLAIEEPLQLGTGEITWVETNKVPLINAAREVIGVLGTYRDVTERHLAAEERLDFVRKLAAAEQAAKMAMYDPLTGLSNRRHLEETLKARLLKSPDECLAIVVLELDRFKTVNDLYGHAVGDELLQRVASLLSDEAGVEGFVARIGGDVFVLIHEYKSEGELDAWLVQLISKFVEPIVLAERRASVGITLGVSRTPCDGIDPQILKRRANMALYCAKKEGRTRFAFYEPGMDDLVEERALLERDLRSAIGLGEIIPFYQPIVHLASGDVSCYEVLARWNHAERGLIPPVEFIKIAEEVGLIGELTLHLLRQACIGTASWPDSPRISINVAPVQLRDAALPQKLLKVLTDCGFPPSRLEIEITENANIFDIELARTVLTSLRTLGVTIALDDFGTGYSSLRQLRELPFDVLKIDQSFVRSMNDNDDALAIVRGIIQLGKSLSLTVTAEGIETEGQALALHALGCERGQGFFLGRPSPSVAKGRPLGNKVMAKAVDLKPSVKETVASGPPHVREDKNGKTKNFAGISLT